MWFPVIVLAYCTDVPLYSLNMSDYDEDFEVVALLRMPYLYMYGPF